MLLYCVHDAFHGFFLLSHFLSHLTLCPLELLFVVGTQLLVVFNFIIYCS